VFRIRTPKLFLKIEPIHDVFDENNNGHISSSSFCELQLSNNDDEEEDKMQPIACKNLSQSQPQE